MPLDLARFPLLFSAALLAAEATHAPAPVAAPSPEQALEAYVGGLRTGRVKELQKLFLPNGQFCTLSEGTKREINCRKFGDVLGGWAARPDPQASGRVLDRHDATPSLSAITYELHFGGVRYIDQLLLYRTGDGWRVVAKTTAAQ